MVVGELSTLAKMGTAALRTVENEALKVEE
jgi:hypothetical protein